MKDFIKKHKKTCIAAGIFILLLLIFFIVFFIVPLFGNNKYGDRLDGIEDYKVSNNVVNDIKDAVSENDFVTKVDYHNEGRILNFIVTINGDTALDTAKGVSNDVLDGLSNKLKKYYDVEIFITTEEDSEIYPVIGYHPKGAKEVSWSNVGDTSE